MSPAAPVTCAVVGDRADRPAGPHHCPVSQFRLQNGRHQQPSVGFSPRLSPGQASTVSLKVSLSCKVFVTFS